MYKFIQDKSIDDFLKNAGPLLYRDEVANSLMLGLCEGMVGNPSKISPLLFRVLQEDETVTAAIQTPPKNLVISYAKPDVLDILILALQKIEADFPGVVGPNKESEYFSDRWSRLVAKKTRLAMGQKIYRLDQVKFPKNIDGSFGMANSEQTQIVHDWVMAFVNESLPPNEVRDAQHWGDFACRAVQKKAAHFWMQNNKPVSMAFVSRPTKNGISVNGVYTPPEFRKKGYASAVVSHLSQKMLDSGQKFCVLYTDLSNPTSNKIYQEIGYREVCDSKHFFFE